MNHLETTAQSPGQFWGAMTEAEIILVFASNTEVLNVEDFLEDAGLPFELEPVPKEVNPNCGLAISFKEEDRAEISAALSRAGFKARAAYLRRGGRFSPLRGPAGPAAPVPEADSG
ncbi:MAG: DUF3343 domain-containing protein [Candidatus Adiutrix sp.]|jgi:hypothetical protein|nr:DUF3343 domain-containing protein [Candidatus Adiutrix sp.]